MNIFFLTLILALALLIRTRSLLQGLSYDEIFSALYFIDVPSWWQTLSSYIEFNNHIAYSLCARLSQMILGQGELALRMPALLFGLAGIGLLWLTAKTFLSPQQALLAALILTLSPLHIKQSQMARGYTAMLFFSLLSSHLYFKLLSHPSRRSYVGFILSSVLAIYFHLYASLVTVIQVVFLFVLLGFPKFIGASKPPFPLNNLFPLIRATILIPLFAVLCYRPVLPQLFNNISQQGHGAFKPLFPLQVIHELSGRLPIPLTIFTFILGLIGIYAFWRSYKYETIYFLSLFFIPLIVLWGISRPYFLYPRFFMYFLPYAILFLSAGIGTLGQWLKQPAPLFLLGRGVYALCLALLFGLWLKTAWQPLKEAGFRDAVAFMESNVTQPTSFLAIGGGYELFPYYSKKYPLLTPTTAQDFINILKSSLEIRCAYRPRHWEKPLHTQIAEFFKRNGATSQRFRNVVVFTFFGPFPKNAARESEKY